MAEGEGKERDGEKEGLTGTLQSEAERKKAPRSWRCALPLPNLQKTYRFL